MESSVLFSKRGNLDKDGREIADPVPAQPTIDHERKQGMVEQMRSVVREFHNELLNQQEDTVEDERDFQEFVDQEEMRSPYELFRDSPEYDLLLDDLKAFDKSEKAKKKAAAKEAAARPKPPAAEASSGSDDAESAADRA